MKLGIVKGKLAAWTIKRLKADNDNVSEETTTGFAGLAPENAEDYTALVAQGGEMQAVAQGQQADNAEVPAGANSVSVQGSAGTSVSLAAPSLGTTTTRGGGIIVPQCTKHALNTYYATDHLGTVRFTKTVDETGTEVATSTHDYEPFGVEITPTDECDNTHKFTGHERDTETGNDYMHFRFFSASMGRFQKPDSNFDNPLSNPQGWNLYSYVHGNPVNFNDPTGHETKPPDNNKKVAQGNTVPYAATGAAGLGNPNAHEGDPAGAEAEADGKDKAGQATGTYDKRTGLNVVTYSSTHTTTTKDAKGNETVTSNIASVTVSYSKTGEVVSATEQNSTRTEFRPADALWKPGIEETTTSPVQELGKSEVGDALKALGEGASALHGDIQSYLAANPGAPITTTLGQHMGAVGSGIMKILQFPMIACPLSIPGKAVVLGAKVAFNQATKERSYEDQFINRGQLGTRQ
jgi:RHS repeat-associated protein